MKKKPNTMSLIAGNQNDRLLGEYSFLFCRKRISFEAVTNASIVEGKANCPVKIPHRRIYFGYTVYICENVLFVYSTRYS